MKKMKKLFAILMTMAMVMGLSITGFAATDATHGSITVSGLVAENTNVKLYKVVSVDGNVNNWVIAEWAKGVKSDDGTDAVDDATNPWTIDWEALAESENLPTSTPYDKTESDGEIEFTDLDLGAYLIIATSQENGTTTQYNVMGTYTTKYDTTTNLMVGNDAEVNAKTSTIKLDKEAIEGDNFVAKGEEVEFKITTSFPSFTKDEIEDGATYKIVDTPTDLQITDITSARIGTTSVTAPNFDFDEDTNTYTLDLSQYIGNNENAGKPVEIIYKAIVLTDDGYSNTANAYRNETSIGESEEEGYSADLTVKKVDGNGADAKTLAGAEFKVYKGTDTSGTLLYFTLTETGVYSLSTQGTEGATSTVVATNGTVQVKGLDEGDYFFDEIKAPAGYAVSPEGVSFKVTNQDQKVSIEKNYVNTKMSALPETGGMGTTLFTIAGCVIMISAAGLFFATRKKAN